MSPWHRFTTCSHGGGVERGSLPFKGKPILIGLSQVLHGMDLNELLRLKLIDIAPQTGGRDAIFLGRRLGQDERCSPAALHGHAEIEVSGSGPQLLEFAGEQERVSDLNESLFPCVRLGREPGDDRGTGSVLAHSGSPRLWMK